MARRRYADRQRVRVFPRTGPLARRPACGELHVESWFETGRAHVAVYNEHNEVLAEWWDAEVLAMFEKGAFKDDDTFEQSVVESLAKVGACRRAGQLYGRN